MYPPDNQDFAQGPGSVQRLERRFIYRRHVRVLHWAVAGLLVVAGALGVAHNLVASSNQALRLLGLHRSAGALVLGAMVVRLAVRLSDGQAPHTGVSPQIRIVATASHAALYLLLLALPLTGWLLSNASHQEVLLFGHALPHLIERSRDLADELPGWHQGAALVVAGMLALHVSAALWHHFVRRDGVLHSMLPLRRLRKPWVDRQLAAVHGGAVPVSAASRVPAAHDD